MSASDFQRALEDIFDSELGEDALFRSGTQPYQAIRILRDDMQGSGGLGGVGVKSNGIKIEVLASQVSAPAEGDKIVLGKYDDAQANDPAFWDDAKVCTVRRVIKSSRDRMFVLTLNKELA